jgi:hypothetical protein
MMKASKNVGHSAFDFIAMSVLWARGAALLNHKYRHIR